MFVLCRNLNYRNILLRDSPVGEVGVLRKNGKIHMVPWLGFISRQSSKKMRNARPVKLQIKRVGFESGLSIDWTEVPEGKYVQGCLVHNGVYAVVDAQITII